MYIHALHIFPHMCHFFEICLIHGYTSFITVSDQENKCKSDLKKVTILDSNTHGSSLGARTKASSNPCNEYENEAIHIKEGDNVEAH